MILLSLLLIGLTNCSSELASSNQQETSPMAKLTIGEVLRQNTDRLMSIPGVVGVAIGERGGRPCILVLVATKTDEVVRKIPSELQGFPVVVEETGAIHRLDRPD